LTTTGRVLASLQFETTSDYEANLTTLSSLASTLTPNSIILAPEVSITGFDYEHFDEAAEYAKTIDKELLTISKDRTIITTMIEKEEGNFYNIAKVYHHGTIIHRQKKHKLFTLGDERKYFSPGEQKDIISFDIDGVKVAILICFELRFTELWLQLKGADIICVPAQWGHLRAEHFTSLYVALAISNQCYVIASDANNEDTTSKSAIITPFGKTFSNQTSMIQSLGFNRKEIQKMRKYIDIGL
jgi:omega-amidase